MTADQWWTLAASCASALLAASIVGYVGMKPANRAQVREWLGSWRGKRDE